MTHHPAVFRSLRILYQIIKILNVTPKQNPEAMRPTTSAPCRAATRSLPRLLKSATNPKKHGINAVNGENIFMRPPKASIQSRRYCDRKSDCVSPQPERQP